MTDLLPPWHLSSAFLAASLLLAVTPGPGVFYIVTRSIAHGRRVGLASVAGVAFGNLGNSIGAALGLAALFAVSSFAFTLVKYAGAAYLIHLGVRALRRWSPVAGEPSRSPASERRAFKDGLVVSLLNPKTTIFFAAFLPQFMTPGEHLVLRSIALSTVFVSIAAITDSCYALAAGRLAPALQRRARAQGLGRYLTAGAFIALGAFTALSGERRLE
jgi:threonine/homoserine/homoserine lactone efflux protein